MSDSIEQKQQSFLESAIVNPPSTFKQIPEGKYLASVNEIKIKVDNDGNTDNSYGEQYMSNLAYTDNPKLNMKKGQFKNPDKGSYPMYMVEFKIRQHGDFKGRRVAKYLIPSHPSVGYAQSCFEFINYLTQAVTPKNMWSAINSMDDLINFFCENWRIYLDQECVIDVEPQEGNDKFVNINNVAPKQKIAPPQLDLKVEPQDEIPF